MARSIWCLLISVIIAFAISFGGSLLILWLIFITNKIKFDVTDAILTQFNFTNNDTQLHYNLGVFFTIRNPNKQIGIYYDTIEATAMYKGQNFDTRLLTPFYQGSRTTSLLKGRFQGQRVVVIPNNTVSELKSEKLSGVYSIEVKFRLSWRLKLGLYKFIRVRPKVGCGFQVPLTSSGTSSFQNAIVLILWLVFITHKIKFNVTDATLTQFNFTNNDTQLQYNLGIYFTIRNPNERVGIYYDTIEATAMYKDQNFDTRLLTPFYQTPKTTSLLRGRFEGQRAVVIGNNKVSELNSEKLAGVYSIDVKFRLSLRLKFGIYKIIRVRPKVECGFQVPLNFTGTSSFPWFQDAIGCHNIQETFPRKSSYMGQCLGRNINRVQEQIYWLKTATVGEEKATVSYTSPH
ncbi:hypothetical protein Csa_001204 [Cucumis sativus]|nr:hypothetical protein Csa_001204 [Cucumis sativus]